MSRPLNPDRGRKSGPSGSHKSPRIILSEGRSGQFDEWRQAAQADDRTLSSWIRKVANAAVKRVRKGLT